MASSPPPLVPPLRFCLVEEGVYRGAYPSLINLRFLTRLELRSMVSLLPEPPTPHLVTWCEENGVSNHYECVKPFSKDDVTLTHERAASLLQLLVLPERQPVYVHCLDGIGVTGLLIMCLRKLMHWAPPPIFAEFSRFARDGTDVPLPPPSHVAAFVHAWKPEQEFLQHLPATPPLWLEVALQLPSTEADVPAIVPAKSTDWPSGPAPEFFERDASSANPGDATGLGGIPRPSSIGRALDALAIEGLTSIRPRRTPS